MSLVTYEQTVASQIDGMLTCQSSLAPLVQPTEGTAKIPHRPSDVEVADLDKFDITPT